MPEIPFSAEGGKLTCEVACFVQVLEEGCDTLTFRLPATNEGNFEAVDVTKEP